MDTSDPPDWWTPFATTSQVSRRPPELLFEFVRPRDRVVVRCELRFLGESYGWEVRFIDGRDEFFAHGAFPLRELAVAWATKERTAMVGSPTGERA